MDKTRTRRPLRKEVGAKETATKLRSKFTPKEFPTKSVATGDARKVKSEALKRKLRRNMK